MAITLLFPGGRLKALVLSYDDGSIHDRRLVEIFNRHGLKGTFHLNSGIIGTDSNHIALEELKTLYAGHEISCHGVNHPFLESQPRTEAMRQVWEDRRSLERYAGVPVTGMSYPFGTYDSATVELLRAAGIEYCRTTLSTGKFSLPDEFLTWHPTCHHRDMLKHLPAFLDCHYSFRLFYVWGHAHEFPRDDNWEIIEEFAEKIAFRPEIWYATNLEAARYIRAGHALVTSADGKMVYNPSGVTVWINSSNGAFPVGPGSTMEI